MTRNIILTSLDALEDDRSLRYYAVKNEYGYSYCAHPVAKGLELQHQSFQ